MFEITPILDYSKNISLYVQLYEYIKKEIQIGTFKPETKLPSKRKLANHLGIMKEKIEIIGEKSGLHVLLKVKNGMTEEELIQSAGKMKIKVYPTSIYYAEVENMISFFNKNHLLKWGGIYF